MCSSSETSKTSHAKGIAMITDHRAKFESDAVAHAARVRRSQEAERQDVRSRVLAKRGYAAAVALSLSLLPLLLAADDPAPPQREANRKRLSEMTVAERKRIEENQRLYHEMTPAERDRLRNLQREIERDPELQAAFREYQIWADSLSPIERYELRQAQDPEARRQLIEKFRRRPPPGERPEPFPSERRPDGPPFGQNNNARGRLIENLFGGIAMPFGDRFGSCVPEMEVIVRTLERELPSDTREELDKLDAYSRKVRVVKLTLERRPIGPPGFRFFGPGSETVEKVFAALPEGPVRQMPVNRNFNPGPNQPDPRATLLVMVLLRGLMTETQRTLEDHRPRPDLLTPFQQKLSQPEQTRLNQLNREDRQQELTLLYVKDQVPGIGELQRMLGTLDMERFIQDINNRFRPGGGPPDGEDRRDKKGRPPPLLDGSRRPRDFEPLPNRPQPKD
ncbi:MAG: hypothetical protein ACKV2Q_04595 [Planctomycetaceae bacterium]